MSTLIEVKELLLETLSRIDRLENIIQNNMTIDGETMLGTKEICEVLGVSQPFFYSRLKHKMPFLTRYNRLYKAPKSEVLKFKFNTQLKSQLK